MNTQTDLIDPYKYHLSIEIGKFSEEFWFSSEDRRSFFNFLSTYLSKFKLGDYGISVADNYGLGIPYQINRNQSTIPNLLIPLIDDFLEYIDTIYRKEHNKK